MNRSLNLIVIAVLSFLIVIPCAVVANPDGSDRVILLPVNYRHYGLRADGTIVSIPLDSEISASNFAYAAELAVQGHPQFELIELPELTDSEQQMLDEHFKLLELVVPVSLFMSEGGYSGWRHKTHGYDYSIGSGLAALSDRVGIDKVVYIGGIKVSISVGRAVLALSLFAATGVTIPVDGETVYAAIVELRTGNILWVDGINAGVQTPDKMDQAIALAKRALDRYPRSRVVKGYAH